MKLRYWILYKFSSVLKDFWDLLQPLWFPTIIPLVKILSLTCFAIYVIKPSVQKQSINPVSALSFPKTSGKGGRRRWDAKHWGLKAEMWIWVKDLRTWVLKKIWNRQTKNNRKVKKQISYGQSSRQDEAIEKWFSEVETLETVRRGFCQGQGRMASNRNPG